MSTEWTSDGGLIVDTDDYKDVSSNLDEYSDFSYDQTNGMDWYFPEVLELCQNSRWLLDENNFSLNESSVSEICNMLKNTILCEFQTEIFLQHPLIIQKLIKWLNENKEKELILECLIYLVEKLIRRHYECTTGLCENNESINSNYDSNSHISIRGTYSESTTNDDISRWGIAKFCVLLMPVLLKHVSLNSGGAFCLFMSSMHLLSSISNSCNVNFYIDLVFSDYTIKNILFNEPLSSLKFLIIAEEILKHGSPNEQFKVIICDILKQPYWIHLYPELYHQLYEKVINEELLEQQIIKRVEDAYILSSTSNLDITQYANLFRSSLPIICFHKQFNIIDKFITNTCKYAKLTETTDNHKEYSNILLSLLSFKSVDVALHTYLALNNTLKKIFNHSNFETKKFERLLNNLLCTNVLNEIICFGCNNSNKEICQSASEMIEQIIKNKNIINNNQWKYFLNNLAPIFPVLYCYADQTSSLGQIVLDLFDPDQAEKLNISKLVLLHSTVAMLFSKDKKSRVEANNRITWILKTSLNRNIELPNDIFLMEIDEVNEHVDKPIGEYNKKDLDDMIDLISNKCSSHQTIKCALYKISVILEHNHLQQHFIHNGGMDIILNLLKSSKLFVNERGLLIALLKLTLCFTKKKKIINDHNSLANNIEIQLQLIAVLSDFHEVPLVKQYVFQIFFYCIFNQYLTSYGEIPKVVVNKINTPIKFNKYSYTTNNSDDTMLFSRIKENHNCMEVLILTWHLKHYDSIDVFLENGLTANSQNDIFNNVFQRFRKACIKWSVKKCLVDLIAAQSHQVALAILGDLKRYLEISVYIEQFEVDEELFENALKKFLILPPIFLTDLQTLIVVLKLLHFALTKRVLMKKLNWVAEILTKSESMHHNLADDFKKDEKSKQLCNQFCIELYEVYWLCLKNYSHFSTLSLTKLLFDRLASSKKEIVLLQINMKCLTLLTENPKNIDKDFVKIYLSQFISLKTILMNNLDEKSLQRSYLIVLNHILHHTILVPNISEVWSMYDWETWTWSMIHSTDLLVRALVFQFSAGLAVIDIPVSHNLIHLALNYFCESSCLENCVVAEQAALFCSNLFCFPKFKSLCHQCIIKLDFDAFVQIINLCSYYDYTKPEKKNFMTSPKLVSNICCMFFNMFTLTEVNLYELDQHSQFLQALFMCLKKYLTPMSIENPNVMEMCGRICSVLTLFIPVSNYNFENVLNSLNVIYERININLDYCTTMVWRSLFRLTTIVIQYTNYKTFVITNNLITALLTSVTSENKDLCIEALNLVSLVCPQLSKKFAHRVCNILIHTLLLEWNHKLKRKMLLTALSNIFIEHPITYETAKHDNDILHFIISKLKIMQLQVTKQSNQKSKILQNEYLEIVKFCCNLFHGCNDAREDASAELPDLVHKLWPIVVANPKSDILMCTLQMLVSLTSACPSACSAMTMTSSTLGMEPKTKCTSFSLFHEVITLSTNFNLNEDILNITLLLVLNCCQAQECRVTITKSKLLSSIVLALNLKDKKCPIKIEQQYLKFLLVLTSYNEGQIHLLKVENVLDTLVDLLKSNYVNDSLAILRNLCFNGQNRAVILSSDVFLDGVKTLLETGNPTDQNYKDISLAIWSIACNNQKARLQLCHWGIDRYFEKLSDLVICSDETKSILNCTYKVLKS